MKRILVVEDEENIRELICLNLKNAGFDALGAPSGEEGLEIFEARGKEIDIVLLDLMLPGMDGMAVCKKIRETSADVGIIMLTAKTQEIDKISGLMNGADDYVTKPFSVSELMARVDAIYRRVSKDSGRGKEILEAGPFKLNLKSRVLYKDDLPVELTQVEYQIIEMFLKNPDTVLDRMHILKEIWGDSYYGDDKIIDVNIRRLRMKVEQEPSHPRHINTVWGVGYRFIP